MKTFSFVVILLFTFLQLINSQNPVYTIDEKGVNLDNGKISRYISIEEGKISTISLRVPESIDNYVSAQNPTISKEFSLNLNGKDLDGSSGWIMDSIQGITEGKGSGITLHLSGHEVQLCISYIMYPDLPLIRKKIDIRNISSQRIKIENPDIESLGLSWGNTHNVVFQSYARYKHLGPFTGGPDDPLVGMQDMAKGRGLLLGNESPGVLKRTTAFNDGGTITIGLTHTNQENPFRVWLEKDELWTSPWSFIVAYIAPDPTAVIEGDVASFVRNHMGIRLAELDKKPAFVYNTWNPFRTEINEGLILNLANAAAECGVEEFIIDDGWQTNRGDWGIDTVKFPNGLKPVFDHIKSKGMKPGLWMALANVEENSKVFREHPEWLVRYKDGSPLNVHGGEDNRFSTCLTTGWKDYIRDIILNLVKEHGLEYLKLDIAIVRGAYMFDESRSGCYAEGHTHIDREESFLEIYRAAWDLFDELHAEAPELFIDCTFETMGTLQMIDYDMCKHAEGNWLANFEEYSPEGGLRIRQMAWWRSPVIPATALVIGNQMLDDPKWEYSLTSLIGTLPIMLGDPMKVKEDDCLKMKKWSQWMREMQDKYDYMMFRQDLPGFGEPAEGKWDAWARINTETAKGGVVGIFRQGAAEISRQVVINGLQDEWMYNVYLAPTGRKLFSKTGKELREKGFAIELEETYDSVILSVEAE